MRRVFICNYCIKIDIISKNKIVILKKKEALRASFFIFF
jgi:hypothetical protein